MAASTFEKTMRNRTISDQRSPPPSTPARDNWSFRVDIHPSDKVLIQSFFRQEVSFYNSLVEGLSARLRSFPEALLAFSGPWEDLFIDLAETGVAIRRFPSKLTDLPARFEKHKHTLYDDNGKWRAMPERTMMILELATGSGNFHPLARRAMAHEMIRFYRQQAQVSMMSVPVHLREEQIYKTAPEILTWIDPTRKRHVQLPREAVVTRYDPKLHRSILHIPYAKHGIEVSGDLSKSQSWNVMILRQMQNDRSTDKSMWQMEVRKSPSLYFIKMLDSVRPNRL